MMFKKKVLAAALGALMVSGSTFAVEVAPAGKGDLLIAPLFMTGGGWTTELKVVNTNTVDSAVAKVVFHAPGRSEEVLDFLIFLSPGDVWVGNVVTNADGSVGVSSSDDSSIVTTTGANNCPNATGTVGFDPMQARFTVPVATGYIDIFETRMIRGLGNAPVAKSAILATYAAACNANQLIAVGDTDNVLTGTVKLSNPTNGNQLTIPMATYANYDNFSYHSVGLLTSFASNIANTTKGQLEDAMWASNFAIPYNNGSGQATYASITFPTKETYNNSAGSQYVPFPGSPSVSYAVRDEQENALGTVGCSFSPCNPANILSLPNEVNLLAIQTGGTIGGSTAGTLNTQTFTKGWVNADIQKDVSDQRSNVNYNNFGNSGSPALVTYLIWNYSAGANSMQGSWLYAPATFTPGAR